MNKISEMCLKINENIWDIRNVYVDMHKIEI